MTDFQNHHTQEVPSKDDGQMSAIIDLLQHYQEPAATESARVQAVFDDNDNSPDQVHKLASIPRSVPANKAEKEADPTRSLHGSMKRSIIDCNNLSNKMRTSSHTLSQNPDASPFSKSGLFNEISQSLEATRLLHGGKPLPGQAAHLAQVQEAEPV